MGNKKVPRRTKTGVRLNKNGKPACNLLSSGVYYYTRFAILREAKK